MGCSVTFNSHRVEKQYLPLVWIVVIAVSRFVCKCMLCNYSNPPPAICKRIRFRYLMNMVTKWHVPFKISYCPQELEIVTKDEFRGANSTFWERIFMELPDGIMQIVIKARRPDEPSLSAIAIDDITVSPCTNFCKGRLHWCLLAPIYLTLFYQHFDQLTIRI